MLARMGGAPRRHQVPGLLRSEWLAGWLGQRRDGTLSLAELPAAADWRAPARRAFKYSELKRGLLQREIHEQIF